MDVPLDRNSWLYSSSPIQLLKTRKVKVFDSFTAQRQEEGWNGLTTISWSCRRVAPETGDVLTPGHFADAFVQNHMRDFQEGLRLR
jgi:hypothetical protein